MKIPDYVSPIVAYRVWRWDGSGLASLMGENWPTGHALTAQCKRVRGVCVGSYNNCHQAPQESCTCGIYAARSLDQLPEIYAAFICGEVYLWGVVVEHELGWRAQYAYPKNLVVPFWMMPVDEKEARYHLEALVAYGVDIFIDDGKEQLPLWKKGSGYEPAGLDYMGKVVSGQVEPDEYLEREGRHEVQSAYGRFLRRHAALQSEILALRHLHQLAVLHKNAPSRPRLQESRGLITSPRRWTPPGSAGPPRLPPPPAVPVHSSWDISRILQCTRHRWPEQWTLAAAT